MRVIARLLRSLQVPRALLQAETAVARDESNLSEEVERLHVRLKPVVAVARWLRIPARVAIAGPSMLPTLAPGDHLLVRRTRCAHEGELVVFFDPESPRRLVVKRVVAAHRDGLEVVGDNPGASRDSRNFGLVPCARLLGVAWYRYSPASRVGRIP